MKLVFKFCDFFRSPSRRERDVGSELVCKLRLESEALGTGPASVRSFRFRTARAELCAHYCHAVAEALIAFRWSRGRKTVRQIRNFAQLP